MPIIRDYADATRIPPYEIQAFAFRDGAGSGHHPLGAPLPPRGLPLPSPDAPDEGWGPLLRRAAIAVLIAVLGFAVLVSSPDERASQRPGYVTD